MSQHIDHIEIKNFKSIRHQKIEGCKRINVFIGYPNVGKSNILEALSLFSLPYLKIAGSKKLTDFIRLKNLSGLFYGTNTNTPIEIKVNDTVLYFRGTYDKNAFYPLKCEYIFKNKYGLADGDGRGDGSVYGGGIESDEKFRVLLELSKKPEILFDADLNVKFINLPNKIGGFGNFEILKYHFSAEKFKPKKVTFPSLIPPFGNNLFEIINSNNELKTLLKDEFEKVNGKYIYDTEIGTGRILKEYKENTFTLPFSSMADTLQRLIFYLAAIASNQNAVLLFEEPEAHMFPPYIKKFNGDIIYDTENNNQYFIVTHSPDVLDNFLEDARNELSVYLVDSKNGETIIKKLSEEELEKVYKYHVDLFFNIESYLD